MHCRNVPHAANQLEQLFNACGEGPGLDGFTQGMRAFAMGEAGKLSRILSPLCGGYFTYASLETGKEAAPGQISVQEIREIYSCLKL